MKIRASSIITCCSLVSELIHFRSFVKRRLAENMHYFVAEMSQLNVGSVSGFPKQAEAIYNENLNAYVKIVLRRPFAKITVCAVVFSFITFLIFAFHTGLFRRYRAVAHDYCPDGSLKEQQLQQIFAEESCQGVRWQRHPQTY
jgi:hypothetical protein